MQRRKIVAGNWKMNKLYDEGIDFAISVSDIVSDGVVTRSGIKPIVVMSPPFHLVKGVAEVTKQVEDVFAAAQNCASEISGAYTGEVSAEMIASAGAKYVIIGHSERRSLFLESDSALARKTELALAANLIPIFCIGELLEQRVANKHFDIVNEQLEKGLFFLEKNTFTSVVIAYEPVWAIGTGHTATPGQAQEMHSFIRKCIAERYDQEVADKSSILYGGSCNPGNAAQLFANPDVDGGLIGGASLKVDDFISIIQAI